jgi:hypothetical protein
VALLVGFADAAHPPDDGQRQLSGQAESLVGCSAGPYTEQMKADPPAGADQAPDSTRDWIADFEAAARRALPLRFRYAFIHTYKPVMDDATYRSFDTMEEYRRWCQESLPAWLGYGRV